MVSLATALVLTACSGGKITPQRTVASDDLDSATEFDGVDQNGVENEYTQELTEDHLKEAFKSVIHAREPGAEMRRSVEQHVAIFYRSQNQLQAFDQELDEIVSSGGTTDAAHASVLTQMKSYPRMLAFSELSHRSRQRVAYVYENLLKVRTTSRRGSTSYKKAHAALSELALYFQKAEGADRLALHSLGGDLAEIFDKYSTRIDRDDRREHQLAFQNIRIESADELRDLTTRQLVKDQIHYRINSLNEHDNDVENTVNTLVPRIKHRLKFMEDNAGREPQANQPRFYPSAGPHGTISGVEYPKGNWSITYDDGPSAKYSPMVLKNLQDHGFKATIFELATNVADIPKISLNYLNAGMEMANHSYTHPQLPKIDDAHLHHEIVDSMNVEVKTWGESHRPTAAHPQLFRCPYGAGLTVTRVRQAIADQHYIHVFWSVDTLDWQDKNPDSVLARAKKEMAAERNGGGIILFHDIHPQSVEASRMLMDYFHEKGLKQRLVGDVIKQLNDQAMGVSSAPSPTPAKAEEVAPHAAE